MAVLNHLHISQPKWNGSYPRRYIDGLKWPTLALVISQFWSSDGIIENSWNHPWQFIEIYLLLCPVRLHSTLSWIEPYDLYLWRWILILCPFLIMWILSFIDYPVDGSHSINHHLLLFFSFLLSLFFLMDESHTIQSSTHSVASSFISHHATITIIHWII